MPVTIMARPLEMPPERLEGFGRELDALRDEVMDDRGERDRRYILGMVRFQRILALAARVVLLGAIWLHPSLDHGLASQIGFLGGLALGTAMLALSKILENMELGHNVMHGQWDWMKDEGIQSTTWEWDNVCPSDQWKHSHNVIHHTWANVLGEDRDIGYGALRVTPRQRWSPIYLFQPILTVLMAVFFEWFVAIHDVEVNRLVSGGKRWKQALPMLRRIGVKARRQMLKDYVLWPALGGPFFLWIVAANFAANVIRNLWTFMIIFCGHFPEGVHHFRKQDVRGETRPQWYVRQMLGSCNVAGGRVFHLLTGNLSHQIEHHLFPDMPSNRLPEIAPRVRAIAEEYGVAYNTGSLSRQFGTTLWKLLRLSFPGPGRPVRPVPTAAVV